MDHTGEGRDVADDTDTGPVTLVEFLVPRLDEPAAVLDGDLTVVAANDTFAGLVGSDRASLGRPLTAFVPTLTAADIERSLDRQGEYATAATVGGMVEFAFERHGSHVLCLARPVDEPTASRTETATLASLGAATRALFDAETTAAVAERLVETATGALSQSGATLYLFDDCRNVLWPASAAGSAGSDERRAVGGMDDSIVRDVFLTGTETTVTDGERYQPLGDYGVFHTTANGRDERTRELVDVLADSAHVALERIDREAVVRERDASKSAQRERLGELERVLSAMRRVHRALVAAESVAEIELGVCEALTESEWVSFAWVGRADGDAVRPRQWAGRGSTYLEAVSLSTADPDGPPAVLASRADELTLVDAIAADIRESDWRAAAISRDFQSALSVPLRIERFEYGVLTLFANQPVRDDGPLTSVFSELGQSVATAIRDQERLARHTRDGGVELDLTVTAPDAPLIRLGSALDSRLHCEAVIPVDGASTRVFVRASGTDTDRMAAAVSSVQHLDSLAAIGTGDRYELLAREPTVVGELLHHGARIRAAHVAAGTLQLTVTLAADTDVRAFLDQVETFCERVELTARRAQPTESGVRGRVRNSLETVLTDRQLEVLRTAYESGFFEWPRTTTGEGVAEILDISQPTVNRHLRVSQRKLLELVFDDD